MLKSDDGTTPALDEADTKAQIELKRAYLHVSFGQFEEAIAACERAQEAAPEHHLPSTLKGSFEMSFGRVRDALATLRKVSRRHSNEPLPQIYFAEACFLAGRRRQGERALAKAEKLCQSDGGEQGDQFDELIDNLRQTWQSVESSKLPPPLVAKLADDSAP